MKESFGEIGFSGKLRPSQVASSSIVKMELYKGSKELLIVAPPGSGKTVLGLYVWSDLVRLPTLVLSPNSAIQAQWVERARELFNLDGRDDEIGTDPKNPGILTSLTYQSVTLPRRGGEELDNSAMEMWISELMTPDEDGAVQAEGMDEAIAWIEDLEQKNSDYHGERMSHYRKKVRDSFSEHGNALWVLHESAKENLKRLADVGIGLIILDECHHLMEHWGKVLAEAREFLGNPIVLGLTATPPEEGTDSAINRYLDLFGEVDYEVPVPALVRDGNLAPYQDLAFFVRPSPDELRYIANVDEEFEELVKVLRRGPEEPKNRAPRLEVWLARVLDDLSLPSGKAKDWASFKRRDPRLADAARAYLAAGGLGLPPEVPQPSAELLATGSSMDTLITVLDRYIRNGLMRSENQEDHGLAEDAKKKLRMLGVQITQNGARACASPVGRVMAYASAKYGALRDILSAEMQALGPDIRAVVVTDFEKTSATALVEEVMDEEAGGAVAAYRAVLSAEATDRLDPVLMTGSTVLVDDDLLERIFPRFESWTSERGLEISFNYVERGDYFEIRGKGKDWLPRYYTMMITELFQEGVTKCLVGTRGLLGEGWDASRINVLVDLTTVTTSMSINQLRGRSFRLDKLWPEKVANNWDIVCLADEFKKGFDDYLRFKRKHKQLYGVCDDGAIEKGVGHVHAAFTEAKPEGVSQAMGAFNEDMIMRARNRERTRELWGIGQPFDAVPREAIEVRGEGLGGSFPPLSRIGVAQWSEESLVLAIGDAVACSLQALGLIGSMARVGGGSRGGGWMRSYLEDATEEESAIFAKAMQEVLGPLDRPRYVIPREVTEESDTWISELLPEVVGKYFRKRQNVLKMYHAVPKVLCRSLEDAQVFEQQWNWKVSPGEVIYGHSKDGKLLVSTIKGSGRAPKSSFHRKSVFL
ncbi:MAG: DEAD/DEAH box helicase family protein [Candidatus Thermoplasmatota archaeon]|nr:DEAD/DEAH box helicase family protein [Candidatus Thermoplasmatota archaeon]